MSTKKQCAKQAARGEGSGPPLPPQPSPLPRQIQTGECLQSLGQAGTRNDKARTHAPHQASPLRWRASDPRSRSESQSFSESRSGGVAARPARAVRRYRYMEGAGVEDERCVTSHPCTPTPVHTSTYCYVRERHRGFRSGVTSDGLQKQPHKGAQRANAELAQN